MIHEIGHGGGTMKIKYPIGSVSESWEDDFDGLKVSDLSEVPKDYRGEVAVVNDHGNVTLYVKSARKLTEIWSIV